MTTTIDSKTLVTELRPLLVDLTEDLLERSKDGNVRAGLESAYRRERTAKRTADTFDVWRRNRCTQVAAAWVLSVVFVRTLEDRGFIERRRIAGIGAEDSQDQLVGIAPFLSARDYLLVVFEELSHLPGAEAVFDARHNPVWIFGPSAKAAERLIEFFRQRDEEGELRFRFEGDDTRFLGDLYQDLSEDVRKRYALLQTPYFIESFILDETLTPAIATFGLQEVKLIDPTCGSGHFLLGAFRRLFDAWREAEPATDHRVLAQRALSQVHGVDLNPYAVAIARFRLTLAFLEAAELTLLADAPSLPFNLTVADSLLHGVSGQEMLLSAGLGLEDRAAWGDELFALEDEGEALRILGERYHAVVGNPPYITVKDAALRDAYRPLYQACYRSYSLVTPFLERMFGLGVDGGYLGVIAGNAFMKREFGKKLIEEVLPRFDLTHVVDTSGAYIPGHGTPTVLLFGRRQRPPDSPVLAVLGKRGEPTTPEDPADGEVWSSIRDHHGEVGFENDYVSVAEVKRERFANHPWSLGGGGTADLKALLEMRSANRLGEFVESIGFACITKQDDVFSQPHSVLERRRLEEDHIRPFGVGEDVRDWSHTPQEWVIFPYDETIQVVDSKLIPEAVKFMWPYRAVLYDRKVFGGKNYREAGKKWFEYGQIPADRFRTPLSIAFAFVATHNHFVLDRGGKVFKQSAPIIKLPEDATEEDHLALLGYLNSSTACFWMKQVMMNKAGSGIGRGIQDELWESRFEFDGTKLGTVPLFQFDDIWRISRAMDELTSRRRALEPRKTIRDFKGQGALFLGEALDIAKNEDRHLLARMVSLQEELDWMIYEAFGLLSEEDLRIHRQAQGEAFPGLPNQLSTNPVDVRKQGLWPGHRPFEVVLARDSLTSGVPTAWFARNGYWSPSQASEAYAPVYQRLIETRIAIIDRNKQIRLIERPEYKHRWTVPSYHDATAQALREFLVDAAERSMSLTAQSPEIRTTRHLAHLLDNDPKVQIVADLLTGESSPDLEKLLTDLIGGEAVPCTSALRYSDTGMEKRHAWEHTWDLQRREDAGEEVEVPVPPKYKQKDFRSGVYWRHRGKLDVPKERFISYPGAESDDAPSPLVGWAGWDHLQQATALSALYQRRKDDDGWAVERLMPLLAGLLELVPWLKQWHNEPNPEYGGERLGDFFESFVAEECRGFGITEETLRDWRPTRKIRGKRGKRKAGGRKPALQPEALMKGIDELAEGDDGVEQRALAGHLGVSAQAVGKVAAKLIDEGKLELASARPKRFRVVDRES